MNAPILHGRALYYPYLEIKNNNWLKTAALFYDGLDRIVPDDYAPDDNRTVKALNHHLGFISNVNPGIAAEKIAPDFLQFAISRLRTEKDRDEMLTKLENKFDYSRTFSIKAGKLGNELITQLPRLGFKIYQGSDKKQYEFDQVTGSIYMAFLANHLASKRNTPVVTDDNLFQPLIRSIQQEDAGDLGYPLASLLIRCAVPQPLEYIPIRKIIRFRKAHESERLRFYKEVDRLTSDLKTVKDGETLENILRYRAKEINSAAQELRNAIRGVKINVSDGLFSLSVPAVAAVGGPWMAAAGVIALGGGKIWSAVTDQKKARAGSPVSYILSLQKLTSSNFLEDLCKVKLLL